MKNLIIVTVLLHLFGCSTLTVPINSKPLVANKATLIIYPTISRRFIEFPDHYDVVMDNKPLGSLMSEHPLKVAITPGYHEFYVDRPINGLIIRRITKKMFKKNMTYYMKVWLEQGLWASSIRITPTKKIRSYTTKSYR